MVNEEKDLSEFDESVTGGNDGYIVKLTKTGREMVAYALGGAPLVFSKVEVGSGVLDEDDFTNVTELKEKRMDASILTDEREGVYEVLNAVIRNDKQGTSLDDGFYLREIGVYATGYIDSGGAPYQTEALYCYIKIKPEAVSWFPSTSEALSRRKIIINTWVGNSPIATSSRTSQEYLTNDDLAAHFVDEDTHKNLWIPGIFCGSCASGSTAGIKEITLPNYNFKVGSCIVIKFAKANSAGNVRLKIIYDGKKAVIANVTGKSGSFTADDNWDDNDYVIFQCIENDNNGNVKFVLLENVTQNIKNKQKGVPNGVAPLNGDGLIEQKYIPDIYVRLTEKGSANGVAPLNGKSKVDAKYLPDYILSSQKEQPNGVATLDNAARVPYNQLPAPYIFSENAPQNTNVFWIDNNRVMWAYNQNLKLWQTVLPSWG